MKKVKDLYFQLRGTPWPALMSSVGDCALYETFLAGCADRVATGAPLDLSTVPEPDEETVTYVTQIRKKADRSMDETAFLEYFEMLEELRSALLDEKE